MLLDTLKLLQCCNSHDECEYLYVSLYSVESGSNCCIFGAKYGHGCVFLLIVVIKI